MPRVTVVLGLAGIALSARSAPAQVRSAAENEVVQAIEQCLRYEQERDFEATAACTHEGFVGWRYDMPALRDKAYGREELRLNWDRSRLVSFSVQPLAVRLYGNLAIVHYYADYVTRDESGRESRERYRWTDIMLKEGGRWRWVADHGGVDPGSGPGEQPN